MDRQHKYRETDRMGDLIVDNFSLLMVMSRFGLKLGFGDKSVKDVCQEQGVDLHTFLAVANFISEGHQEFIDDEQISLTSLMDYLKNAHTYFLDFNLPTIRRKLIEALDFASDNNVSILIMKFFDEYAKEVFRHMEYENKSVFKYVNQLLEGKLSDKYNIVAYSSKHNQIDTKLKELKNIIIKYYPEEGNNNLMNSVLFDIFNCEQDLVSHGEVEDFMFVPAVARLERRLRDEKQ
ncbi:MAG: hemerythrin domain-containing protein [Bacteroidaceae bacterium]|nr:hemerythrin domain-containing protein [Bacteroidaceae bacterium]